MEEPTKTPWDEPGTIARYRVALVREPSTPYDAPILCERPTPWRASSAASWPTRTASLDYGLSHRWHDAQLVRLYFDLCGERMTLDETIEFYCSRLEAIGEVLRADTGSRWTLEALAALRPDKPLWTRHPPS